MRIDGLGFTFVSSITLECDSSGNPIEYSPADKYESRKNLALNKWGEGPCFFRLDSAQSCAPTNCVQPT